MKTRIKEIGNLELIRVQHSVEEEFAPNQKAHFDKIYYEINQKSFFGLANKEVFKTSDIYLAREFFNKLPLVTNCKNKTEFIAIFKKIDNPSIIGELYEKLPKKILQINNQERLSVIKELPNLTKILFDKKEIEALPLSLALEVCIKDPGQLYSFLGEEKENNNNLITSIFRQTKNPNIFREIPQVHFKEIKHELLGTSIEAIEFLDLDLRDEINLYYNASSNEAEYLVHFISSEAKEECSNILAEYATQLKHDTLDIKWEEEQIADYSEKFGLVALCGEYTGNGIYLTKPIEDSFNTDDFIKWVTSKEDIGDSLLMEVSIDLLKFSFREGTQTKEFVHRLIDNIHKGSTVKHDLIKYIDDQIVDKSIAKKICELSKPIIKLDIEYSDSIVKIKKLLGKEFKNYVEKRPEIKMSIK